jgi:hypothetical protein
MLGHNGSCASMMWLVLRAGRTSEPRMNPVATPTAADSGYPGGTPCLASHVIDHVMIYILFIVILLLPIPAACLLCPLLAPTAEQLPLPTPWARVGVG